MGKTHLKFCFFFINNASITHKMRFLCINGFILETCHKCMIISLHGNVNNSKFIKKIPPNLDQPPPFRPRTVQTTIFIEAILTTNLAAVVCVCVCVCVRKI